MKMMCWIQEGNFYLLILLLCSIQLQAQIEERPPLTDLELDSLFIESVEARENVPLKILHAEPLYIDLIRDLGARKGEKEWNVGFGLTDKKNHDEYLALVEYEWAPIDRLGLEIELPFTFHYRTEEAGDVPQSRLNSLKLAAQWSFLVSDKAKTTLALGYLHEFELVPFKQYGSQRLYEGNIFNPFFIAAKRWGNNYHTLIYAGPEFFQYFETPGYRLNWQINSNFHYMIPGTRNFIGVEVNKDFSKEKVKMILRPQMRVAIKDNLMIGIVTGIPLKRGNERFSTFLRIIYEPEH